MATTISVEGLGALQKDLKNIYGKLNKKELAKMLRPGANILRKEVKSRAPRRTGTLKNAVRVRTARGKAKDPTATLDVYFGKNYTTKSGKKVKPYYALFVHNGTIATEGKRKHRKINSEQRSSQRQRIKPNPFVYEAFEAAVERAAQAVFDKIKTEIL